ncbi:hypothetical protein KC19_1G317000 [Ceratodon purpureus]|uniref:Uncharacterized protein n=1 Tax=Ceratodon purpureus TaxID=3225 RepID=A0A8T0JF07_CERPU|nr:hypothetical protein KC19_1G317000 [Ceratodon purpureus]
MEIKSCSCESSWAHLFASVWSRLCNMPLVSALSCTASCIDSGVNFYKLHLKEGNYSILFILHAPGFQVLTGEKFVAFFLFFAGAVDVWQWCSEN